MGEIVNLRMARKARARAAGKAETAVNRTKHGRSKAERKACEADAARLLRTVEGARREKED